MPVLQTTELAGMAHDMEPTHRCHLCRKTFRQKSSLIRHCKKCTLEPRPSVRQKACKTCTIAKARCDLVRPSCSRCATRGVECVYLRPAAVSLVSCTSPLLSAAIASPALAATGMSIGAVDPNVPSLDCSHLFPSAADDDFVESLAAAQNGAAMTTGFSNNTTSSSPITTTNGGGENSNVGDTTTHFQDPCLCGSTATTTTTATPDLGLSTLSTSSSPLSLGDLGPPPKTPEDLDSWMLALVSRPVIPDPKELVVHSMRFVLRVLRTWPRMLAKGFQLPPMIHALQLNEGVPLPLANCILLCKMWAGQGESVTPIVEVAVRNEVDAILEKYREYDQPTMLAAFQSIVICLLLLAFPSPQQTSFSIIPGSLWERIQSMGSFVAASGLVLQEESQHVRPPWQVWSHVESKRRAMMSLYVLHWAHSVYYNAQQDLDCHRLSRVPASAAKFLWQATDEEAWNTLYTRWLAQWEGHTFIQAEFMTIGPGIVMNRRVETWLEDADEFGFITMALVNAAERGLSTVLVE